jgi:hypothetical protein
VYWNPHSVFFSGKPAEEMKNLFKQGICTKLEQPKGYKYSKYMYSFCVLSDIKVNVRKNT